MIKLHSNSWLGPDVVRKFASYDPFGADLPIDAFSSSLDSLLRWSIANFAYDLASGDISRGAYKRALNDLLKLHFGAEFESDIAKRSEIYVAAAYADGAETADNKLRSLGASLDDIEDSRERVTGALSQAVDGTVSRLSDGVGGTFRVQLRDLVGEGIELGENTNQIAARVREWAGANNDPARQTRARSIMIARTETRRAQIDAQVTSWEATKLVAGKQWLVAPNPCQFCQVAGKTGVLPFRKPFYKLGEVLVGSKGGRMLLDYETIYGPPLHPNCRCDLLPVPIRR